MTQTITFEEPTIMAKKSAAHDSICRTSLLSWSHFLVLLPIENEEQRLFYAQKAMEGLWGKRELRKQIELKAYERSEIADSQ